MKFTHHPRVEIEDWQFEPSRIYSQLDVGRPKPNGFWLGVNDDWKRWCDDSGMEWAEAEPVEFALDLGNILFLKTESALSQFTEEYKTDDGVALDAGYTFYIDWESVAARYSGILIAPYMWIPPLTMMWYYGWDCASACIWDLSVLGIREKVNR